MAFLSKGNVDVFLSPPTDTPDGVVGLLARSVGGQGGETNLTSDNGGDGGSAGAVQLTAGRSDLSAVTTINVGVTQAASGTSAGILAQSIGGNGGNQDSNNAFGGDGGNAGSTTADLYWVNLNTTGNDVAGARAYSLGGNGGSDNMNSYRTSGGNGGTAGNVTVALASKGSQDGQQTSITTTGNQAIGVSAQSIGGYGAAAVKQGGLGQNGANAQITADVNSVVSTAGNYSIGMLAQSIGGGGGTGEDFTSSLPGGSGKGGSGGNGTAATIQSTGAVNTQGQYAHGIVVQSIGASGGAGAVSSSIVALGGTGGAGGSGGVVTISGPLQVATSGDSAIGVIGQSIGGGGGTAGSASGLFAVGGSVNSSQSNNADKVSVAGGTVATQGDGSIGILAQSVGGSGGSGGAAAGVTAVGGSGSSGSSGGAVIVDPGTSITTQGKYALGVVAQSIGGGGGNGGKALSIPSGAPAVGIGGSAKSGSSGGTVTVQNSLASASKISTFGDGSTGILAQSIGGGGGNGGSAHVTGLLTSAAVAVGGKSGGGGNGNQVDIALSDLTLATQGIAAPGILTQSIGGGGGNGGAAHSFVENLGFTVGVAVGGAGGAGGSGGQLSVNLDNVTVSTAGVGVSGSNPNAQGVSAERADSYGVVAQSIGGGGGNGGSAAASSITVPEPIPDSDASFAIAADVAVGGKGGSGGDGGDINLKMVDGTAIYSGGQGSHGVLAQSIAGGGGNGGASNAMSTDVSIPSQSVSVNIDIAVGGAGASGGKSGNIVVSMDPTSTITTFDDLSNGLMMQSITGGGGNAGVGSSASGGLSQGKTIKVGVGVGGTAGNSNLGGNITATTAAGSVIKTYGSGSRGILLQSVGGSGGAAQGTTVDVGLPLSYTKGGGAAQDDPPKTTYTLSADVSVSVGGKGGVGSAGGAITMNAAGTVNTSGSDADGILIQSIGGGGGLGGNAGADASAGPSSYAVPTVPPSEDPPKDGGDPPKPEDKDLGKYSLSVAVGGRGGAGGNGGAVDVGYTGVTTTQGDFSDAMVIQSIGGGGGTGGASTAKGAKGTNTLNVAVGGAGAAAGNGGNITLNMLGDQYGTQSYFGTAGHVSYGLLAQSIGGGGGQGSAGSDIVAKSSKTPTMLVGVGGAEGNGGNGGIVSMNASNSAVTVNTSGYDSHGIVLQSIGGGGGIGSISGAGLNGIDVSGMPENPQLVLKFGGGGTTGDSNGGQVNVDSWVNIATSGDHAFGLIAQSIGGGGGIMSAGPGANIASVALAAPSSSNSLNGGDLNIQLVSNNAYSADYVQSKILTSGRGAHGVVLQSIAGGGGIGGDTANGPLAIGWTDGDTGPFGRHRSGNVVLDFDGLIVTTGEGAYGVIAQSLSAPGGLGGNSAGSFAGTLNQTKGGAGGEAGAIQLGLKGRVQTSGANAYAVFAQTYDTESSTPQPVSINVAGIVAGGLTNSVGKTGGAIWIDSPAASAVTINGNGTVNGYEGYAAILQTGSGTTNVSNFGQLYGTTLLGTNTSATPGTLSNFGTFAHADLVQGHVVNQGQMFIGKSTGGVKTHVTGDFTQGSQGVLHVAPDFANQSTDVLTVAGHANLDGQVKVIANSLMPNRELTFLQAGGLTQNAQLLGESNLFTYNSRRVDNTLTLSVDSARLNEVSALHGVADNLHAVGSHLQDVWDRGSKPEFGKLYAALNRSAALGAEDYTNALNDLSPGVLAAPAALKQASMISFSDSLMSCHALDGAGTQMRERDCDWGRVTGNTLRLDGSLGTSGLKSEHVMLQMGAQRNIAPNWFVGIAGAYENQKIRSDDSRQHLNGENGYLGVSLKYENGPWALAGAFTGSYGSFDNTRRIALMGAEAKSNSRVMSIGQRLRVSYTHAMPQSYIKPYIDLDVVHTRMPSFKERGAGVLNLHVQSSKKSSAAVSPGVEVGGRFDLKNAYTVRPYANVGVALSSTGKFDTRSHLAIASASTTSFKSTLDTGRVLGQVSGGIEVSSNKGMDVRLQYDGLFSNKMRSHSGSVKVSWKF